MTPAYPFSTLKKAEDGTLSLLDECSSIYTARRESVPYWVAEKGLTVVIRDNRTMEILPGEHTPWRRK